MLTLSQTKAISHLFKYARQHRSEVLKEINDILYFSNIPESTYQQALNMIRNHGRIALHFHPDRIDNKGEIVIESLLACGKYKNQFETNISSGSVSAIRGGERDRWEQIIFHNSYHESIAISERPKYGALDFRLSPDGPSPRFGSCYFLLKPHVLNRTTFTYLDSYLEPRERGTIEEFDMVMLGIFKDIFFREIALGSNIQKISRFLEHVTENLNRKTYDESKHSNHNLDTYVEAQVHGPITLATDVEAFVADPSYKDTSIGQSINQLCDKYHLELRWHGGFRLSTVEIPTDFRGPMMPSIAEQVARNGYITPWLIGETAQLIVRQPQASRIKADPQQALQYMKYLWHILLKFGKPWKKD